MVQLLSQARTKDRNCSLALFVSYRPVKSCVASVSGLHQGVAVLPPLQGQDLRTGSHVLSLLLESQTLTSIPRSRLGCTTSIWASWPSLLSWPAPSTSLYSPSAQICRSLWAKYRMLVSLISAFSAHAGRLAAAESASTAVPWAAVFTGCAEACGHAVQAMVDCEHHMALLPHGISAYCFHAAISTTVGCDSIEHSLLR